MLRSCVLALVLIGSPLVPARSAGVNEATTGLVRSATKDASGLRAMFERDDAALTPRRGAFACLRLAFLHDKLEILANVKPDPTEVAPSKTNVTLQNVARDAQTLSKSYCGATGDPRAPTSQVVESLRGIENRLVAIDGASIGTPNPNDFDLAGTAAATATREHDLAEELKAARARDLNTTEFADEYAHLCHELGHTIFATENLQVVRSARHAAHANDADRQCDTSMRELRQAWIDVSLGFCALRRPGVIDQSVIDAVELNGARMNAAVQSCLAN